MGEKMRILKHLQLGDKVFFVALNSICRGTVTKIFYNDASAQDIGYLIVDDVSVHSYSLTSDLVFIHLSDLLDKLKANFISKYT